LMRKFMAVTLQGELFRTEAEVDGHIEVSWFLSGQISIDGITRGQQIFLAQLNRGSAKGAFCNF
jgi:hypothetical protein